LFDIFYDKYVFGDKIVSDQGHYVWSKLLYYVKNWINDILCYILDNIHAVHIFCRTLYY